MSEKTVVFTGGGSGGHVFPAIVLIRELKKKGVPIHYIGSETAIESTLIPKEGISYSAIKTGKLRRYFSWKNFTDIFRIAWGMLQSIAILMRLGGRKKVLVFSTGGYISVPVGVACKVLGVDIFIHEQTSRIGLANKIVSRFAKKIYISFEESKKFFPGQKTMLSGQPVREIFFRAFSDEQIDFEGIDFKKIERPLVVVTGGGNGSLLINEKIKQELERLKERYVIIHQVGKDFIETYQQLSDTHYIPVDFIGEEMAFLYRRADIIVSRAGAGTVAELMAIGKPSIFIPLKIAQKNEQYHNAMEAQNKLGSFVIDEDDFKSKDLVNLFEDFRQKTANRKNARKVEGTKDRATEILIGEILAARK